MPSRTTKPVEKCAHIGSYCWMSSVPPLKVMVPWYSVSFTAAISRFGASSPHDEPKSRTTRWPRVARTFWTLVVNRRGVVRGGRGGPPRRGQLWRAFG